MIYVMSDIHGHLPRFESILSQINLTPEDHLFVLGDVIDRGPDGIHILQRLFRMPNVTVLMGNHEQLLLRALVTPAGLENVKLWYQNGGKPTHAAWAALPLKEKLELLQGIQKCPLNAEVTLGGKTYLLTHGAPMELFDPQTSKWANPIQHTLWTRIQPEDKMPEGKTVIFGHTPTCFYQPMMQPAVWYGKDKIGIDCACFADFGRLACLRLDDMRVFYSRDASEN